MSSIDKRIVEMQFNSNGFQQGVKGVLDSLKQLDEKLKMKNATNGLQDVDKGIKNLTSSGLGSLSSGVEAVTSRFSALGVMGVTALANITNSAVNAGKRLASSLTIDPIKSGFGEYETKMGAIQTILTNTAHQGTTLEDVNKTLAELNTYADQTIYNFAEMTKNIGTFTAAGVDLDTSTAAIKGIANLAAASGSTSAQASTAMYQLSQALAAGKVSLMDWNSVVNAGMGGKLFQDSLIRTSKVLGTGAEAAIEKYGSFRESLTKGEWLTTEVLTETLKQISGAYTEADLIAQGYTKSQAQQILELAKNATAAATEVKTITQLMDTMKEAVGSGWATSWEWIIGDKEQATKTLTAVKDAFEALIKPSTDARNTMLQFWNENGGRDAAFEGVANIFNSLVKGFSAIGQGFRDVFPALDGKKLVELSKGFLDLTEKFKMSDKTAEKIRQTFKGLFSVVDFGKNAIVSIVSAFNPLVQNLPRIQEVILSVTSSIGKFFSNAASAAKTSGIFDAITSGIQGFIMGIGNFVDNALNGIDGLFKAIGKLNLQPLMDTIKTIGGGLGKGIETVFGGIGKALSTINFNTIIGGLAALAAGKNLSVIKDIGKTFKDMFNNIGKIPGNFTGLLGEAKAALQSYQNDLNANTLIKIAAAIGILAMSLGLLSSLKSADLSNGLSAITIIMAELVGAMLLMQKFAGGSSGGGLFDNALSILTGGNKMSILAKDMLFFAGAVLMLSFAVKSMSKLNWNELAVGLSGIAGSMLIMIGATKLMGSGTKGLTSTAIGIGILATSLIVMAHAVKAFGNIDSEKLMTGLAGIGVALAGLAAFLNFTSFKGFGTGSAVGLIGLAAALLIMAQAVDKFGQIKMDVLFQGLGSIAAALGTLAAFVGLVKPASLIATSVGVGLMAAALLVLSSAVSSIGNIPLDKVGTGLLAMGGSLAIIAAAVALIPAGSLIATSVGIGMMSAALIALSIALQSMGGMSWKEIGRSLVTLAGSLTVLGVAMYGMSAGLPGAAAMLVMSAALALFIPQLLALSQLSLTQIGLGLLAMAGAFTVLGVATAVLTPLVPSMLGLAAAIALLGVGCVAAGAGVALFATGLATLAGVGAGGVFVITEALRNLINLLPQLGTKMAEGLANFIQGLAEAAPKIVTAIGDLISSLLDAFTSALPKIAESGTKLIETLCGVIQDSLPRIIDTGVDMILAILQGINDNIGKIAQVSVDIIIKFVDTLSANVGRLIQAGINLAINLIDGLANGITQNAPRVRQAFMNLIIAVIAAITGMNPQFLAKGIEAVTKFASGILNGVGKAVSAGKNVVTGAVRGMKSGVSGAFSVGSSIISGLISGIKSAAGKVATAAKNVVTGAIDAAKKALKINSPSKVFMSMGYSTGEGLVMGIDGSASDVRKSAVGMANNAINSMQGAMKRIYDAVDTGIDSNPTIRPVIDLSNVENGARAINGMMSNASLDARVSGRLSRSIDQIQNGNSNHDIVSALKDLKASMNNTGNTTNYINGVTYDDGSNITDAVEAIVRAAKIERRR